MINNILRHGNFTSSGISALLTTGKQTQGFGVGAITYISEKRMERMLGRALDKEENARSLTWGKTLESYVFSLLGLDYTLTSDETKAHPEIEYWAGSVDGMREGEQRAAIDIKCPVTLKSFCQLVMPLYCGMSGIDAMNAIRFGFDIDGVSYEKHKDGEKYYWQLVSNACINGVDFAELIIYCPYQSELPAIRSHCETNPKAYWIWASEDEELPYLPNDGKFQNVNVIRFEIPQEDKDLLKSKVIKAGELLGVSSVIIVEHDKEVGALIVR